MQRKTKIIATLGPATSDRETIAKLLDRGADVVRLNFSHGTHEEHAARFALIRDLASHIDRPVAVMQDIQGPKIRVGTFPDGSVDLVEGATVHLQPGEGVGDSSNINVAYLDGVEVTEGSRIVLSDGLIELEATRVTTAGIDATVVTGGELKDHKGAAFPGASTSMPAVTTKDEEDLAFGAALGVDYVAASFVNHARDVRTVREMAGDARIIAKIETAMGYRNLDEILQEAHGAMVARGDLGVELSIELVPRAQAEIVGKTNASGGLSIVATEMLESMITSPRPTRAEVSDVYQSVLDGADAVMLSAETAIGHYPTRAVRLMASVCAEADGSPEYGRVQNLDNLVRGEPFASATAKAAVDAADRLGLRAIVAFTESGTSARLIAKFRPSADIYAFTPRLDTYRRMAMYGGVRAMVIDRVTSTDAMIEAAERELLRRGIVDDGDGVVMIAGVPPNQQASTNIMKLHVIGSGDRLAARSGGGIFPVD